MVQKNNVYVPIHNGHNYIFVDYNTGHNAYIASFRDDPFFGSGDTSEDALISLAKSLRKMADDIDIIVKDRKFDVI